MANALENAKMKWKDASDYDQLSLDSSTLLGVESSGNIFVVNPDSGVQTLSAVGGVIVTKTALGPSYKLVDSVALMRVANEGTTLGGLDTVDVAIFEGHAEAELQPLYAGAGVGFNLAGGSASIFDFNLGAGLSTGAGLKDESIELKLAGTGVTVGRKISISVFDNSFGIDFVRSAHAVWAVGKEIFAAVAVVPGAMADGGSALLNEFKAMPSTFASAGVDLWTGVKQIPGAFAQIPGAFAYAGKQLGGMIADGAVAVAGGVADAATTVAGGVADGAVAVAGGVAGAATTVAGGVADAATAVADVASDAVDAAKKTAGKVLDTINPFNW